MEKYNPTNMSPAQKTYKHTQTHTMETKEMSQKRFRNACFTSFSQDCRERVEANLDFFSYVILQQEICPTTGKEHWQGYCEFRTRPGLRGIKRVLGDDVHVEARHGTAQEASDYCKKPETAIPNTLFEHGEISHPGKRSDLISIYSELKEGKTDAELLEMFPGTYMRLTRGIQNARNVLDRSRRPLWRDITVTVFYGDTGTGKTRSVYEKHPDLYALDNPMGQSLWWDGYSGQSTLLLDDFYGWIRHSYLLRLLDGYPCRLAVKGSFTEAFWTEVYITSNRHPREWYSKLGVRPELKRRIHHVYLYSEGADPQEEELVVEMPAASSVSDE